MRRRMLAVAAAVTLALTMTPADAHHSGSCSTIKADCAKVRRLIREFWPDHEEGHVIACFDDESGLYKWSNHRAGSQYKGVAQLSRDIRRAHGWSWKLRRQIAIAYQVWRYDRERGRSMSERWYAPAC